MTGTSALGFFDSSDFHHGSLGKCLGRFKNVSRKSTRMAFAAATKIHSRAIQPTGRGRLVTHKGNRSVDMLKLLH